MFAMDNKYITCCWLSEVSYAIHFNQVATHYITTSSTLQRNGNLQMLFNITETRLNVIHINCPWFQQSSPMRSILGTEKPLQNFLGRIQVDLKKHKIK